jgi:hypothetical protein
VEVEKRNIATRLLQNQLTQRCLLGRPLLQNFFAFKLKLIEGSRVSKVINKEERLFEELRHKKIGNHGVLQAELLFGQSTGLVNQLLSRLEWNFKVSIPQHHAQAVFEMKFALTKELQVLDAAFQIVNFREIF